jgi:hypothetical protein
LNQMSTELEAITLSITLPIELLNLSQMHPMYF